MASPAGYHDRGDRQQHADDGARQQNRADAARERALLALAVPPGRAAGRAPVDDADRLVTEAGVEAGHE